MPPYDGQIFKVKDEAPTIEGNARSIVVVNSLLKGAITAVVSSIITCLIAVPATLYNAGLKTATDRDRVQRIVEQQAADHEAQARLVSTVQTLSDSVILLTSKVSQMVPLQVHEARWADIDHQLKAVDSKVDSLGQDVRTVNQNVLRLSERVK